MSMSVSSLKVRPLPAECSSAIGDFFYLISRHPRLEVNFDRPLLSRKGLDLLVEFDVDVNEFKPDSRGIHYGNRFVHRLMNLLNRNGLLCSFHMTDSKVFGYKHYYFRICIFC